MNPRDTILVFAPPPWPVVLTSVAALLLAWELAWLLMNIWRGRSVRAAMGLTAALLGGPLTALVAGVYGTAGGTQGRPLLGRGMLAASLKATLLAVLVLLMVSWPLEGSLVAITVCALAWAVRGYGRTTSATSRAWKAVLLALRVAAILLIGLWALGPQLEYRVDTEVRRTLLVAVDTSASMQRRDVPGRAMLGAEGEPVPPISRIEAVDHHLQGAMGELRRIAEDADVGVLAFSTTPQTLGTLLNREELDLRLPAATGQATAIGDAVQTAADSFLRQGLELAGIVLISDGCNNTAESVTPEKFASRMALSGVPIHTVGVGSDQVTRSTLALNVKELAAPDQINAFNRLPIRATVESFGLKGRTIRVSYRFGDEPNQPYRGRDDPNRVKVLAVESQREKLSVSFVHVPLASGFHRLTVEAECIDPPRGLTGRFVASKLVQVVDRELRVLYLEGQYRYEVKFITQALASGGRFGVDRRILLQPLKPDSPPPMSERLQEWLRYHAIIFGDLGASSLSRRQHRIIKDLVGTYGKGFCMIGGSRSFGRGGWQDTPVADAMPVDLSRCADQIDEEIQVVPTREGLASEIMSIGREGQDVASAWKELSVLPGANRLDGVKMGAEVLATTADGRPLIVTQNYGRGRSMAVAFDTTWLWVTTKDTGDFQRRFWRQVALYLCAPKGNVWITTDKPVYDLRRLAGGKQVVEISGGVEDPRGLPIPDAPVKVTLVSPTGRAATLQLLKEDAQRVARLSAVQLAAPGTYVLKIEAEVDGKPLTAEHRFEVQRRDLEALDVLANIELLRRVADESKGLYVPLSELRDLLARLRPETEPKIVPRICHFDLGGYLRWPVVAAMIALLCLEWAFRKRKGLV